MEIGDDVVLRCWIDFGLSGWENKAAERPADGEERETAVVVGVRVWVWVWISSPNDDDDQTTSLSSSSSSSPSFCDWRAGGSGRRVSIRGSFSLTMAY